MEIYKTTIEHLAALIGLYPELANYGRLYELTDEDDDDDDGGGKSAASKVTGFRCEYVNKLTNNENGEEETIYTELTVRKVKEENKIVMELYKIKGDKVISEIKISLAKT
jgi:hypothetical protein